jgi:hypothetical protein
MDQLKEVGWGILICPIEKWYYKKEQSNFKTQIQILTRWNLEFINKHE